MNNRRIEELALHEQVKELKTQIPNWTSVKHKLPDTYGSYDAHGNALVVSDIVITNAGPACYCSKHEFYGKAAWVEVDWDSKHAGNMLKGVTHWAPLPTPPEQVK